MGQEPHRCREETGTGGLHASWQLTILLVEDVANDALPYRLGANSYFVKPIDFDRLKNLVRILHEYWVQAERPAHAEHC